MAYPDLDRRILDSNDDDCVTDPKPDLYVVPPIETERLQAKGEIHKIKALISNRRKHLHVHLESKSKFFYSNKTLRTIIKNKHKEIFLVLCLFGLPPPIHLQIFLNISIDCFLIGVIFKKSNKVQPITQGGKIMQELWTGVKRFLVEEEGATATEYAIMLALIIIVSIAAITGLGNSVNDTFSEINAAVDK